MTTAEQPITSPGSLPPGLSRPRRRFHRIRTLRLQRGLTLQQVAEQTGVDVRQLRLQEQETSDLRVSDLRRWQRVLNVPLEALLVEPDSTLSTASLDSFGLGQLLQFAVRIEREATTAKLRRLAETLQLQLAELELPPQASVAGSEADQSHAA